MSFSFGFFGQSAPFTEATLNHLEKLDSQLRPALIVEATASQVGRQPYRFFNSERDHGAHGERRRRRWGLGRGAARSALGVWAAKRGIPLMQTRRVNHPAVRRCLAEWGLEGMLCAGFPTILQPGILELFPQGVLNAHPSMLPEFRGPCPIFWALRRGDRRLGVTIHQMNARPDAGPIAAQGTWLRPRAARGEELYTLAGKLAAKLFHDISYSWKSGNLILVPQACDGEMVWARRPKPTDVGIEPAEWGGQHLLDFTQGSPTISWNPRVSALPAPSRLSPPVPM